MWWKKTTGNIDTNLQNLDLCCIVQFEHFQGTHIILKLHYIQDQKAGFIKVVQMYSETANIMDLIVSSVW